MTVKYLGYTGNPLHADLDQLIADIAAAEANATAALAAVAGAISFVNVSAQAGATTAAKFVAAIASLPATGGFIDARSLTGTQTLTAQVAITKPNVTVLFAQSSWTLSGVAAVQSPFGANFLVSAANVWLISEGRNTKLTHANGSQSTMVTFIHGAKTGGIIGFELDGNKTGNTSIAADSFQSGVSLVSDTAGGATAQSQVTVTDCIIHDFNHYGIQTYGNRSGQNYFLRNRVYSNGKADANGTGDGIYINLGSQQNYLDGNFCYANQRSGIRFTAVGVNCFANKATHNWCYSNGEDGIRADEQLNFGSTAGTGQFGLQLLGNHCFSNTGSGIFLFTADNVGVMANATVSENHCYSNGGWGIRLNGNNDATSNTRQVKVLGNQCYLNTQDGIAVGSDVLDTEVLLNTSLNNTSSPILDLGTRTTQVGNKITVADGVFRIAGALSVGDYVQALTFALLAGGSYTASELGVRSWSIKALSGNLEMDSGDGLGSVKSNTTVDAAGYKVGGTKVLGLQDTGWVNQTAVASKADIGAAPTVAQIAGWVKAIDVLLKQNGITHT